jgi:hypothetical protein
MPSITTQQLPTKSKMDEPPMTLIAKPIDTFKPIILTAQPQQAPQLQPTIINLTSDNNTDNLNDKNSDNSNKELLLASMLKVEMGPDDSQKSDVDYASIEPNQSLIISPMEMQNKTKRYKCNACPYETDSKSQFFHHKSFHKPRNESYQCKFCSYNVSKRHLLNQHVKMHTNINLGGDGNEEIMNDVDNPTTSSERLLHFCSICPARYLSLKEILQHFKMHMSPAQKNKCEHCSFSSADESHVKAHSAVHTMYYQEKTKEFIAKYKIACEFPNPELVSLKQSLNENNAMEEVWIVKNSENENENDQDNDEESSDVKFDESCPYCPLQATSLDQLKDHLQHHYSVSNLNRAGKCSHCDYSDDDLDRLKEHTKLHFSLICENNKNLDLFTSFCGLELSITKINKSLNNSNDTNNNSVNESDELVIYKENEVKEFEDGKSEKIVIDV